MTCNDVGLLSEQIDLHTGRMRGNFPQAYSHVGLINSALNLARRPVRPTRGHSRALQILMLHMLLRCPG
jgi:hypothetical protein